MSEFNENDIKLETPETEEVSSSEPAVEAAAGSAKKSMFTPVRLAKMGMLVAISVVLVFIHIPFPPLPFLEYDPADIPIFVGAFAFGPVAGICITFIAALIQATTVSAASGAYGFIMHVIATGSFVAVAGNIYSRKKSKGGAIFALLAGTITMIIVMVFANYIITPSFMGMPREAIVGLLPLIALFNFLKAGINSLITFLLYKRISGFLHK